MTKSRTLSLAWGAILSFVFLSLDAPAQSQSSIGGRADSLSYPIVKYVNQFSNDKTEKTSVGYQYWFVDSLLAGGRTMKLSVVNPHSATHEPHSHAAEEFFFVLEGKVVFYLAGQRKVVGPYASMYCPPNVEHGIRNIGDTEAKYLVVKRYGQ